MYLDQGPGRPPLRAHLSKHFRTSFGNVSKPSTRSVAKHPQSRCYMLYPHLRPPRNQSNRSETTRTEQSEQVLDLNH
ncbi:hypothetical protein PGTUg99_023422 [Puccinia graminis f. sp. tritici]|uniref:Uncharacterized protein n=1 Tax=Puccinia graminis f. sp. tritici TaxID=56615 RepID=A0A5B0R5N0_PUCGR|nr:hypothetical protein PGTUg99_023422 [Puccinia graminis f. sp. tritici]